MNQTTILKYRSGFRAINFRDLWEYRELLFTLADRDIRVRYKQTALGVSWVILVPLIAAGIFLVSAVDQALMQNYVSFLRFDKGMDLRATISWAGSLLAVIGVVAKVGSGWFYDRFSIRGIAFFYFLLAASVFLGLPVAGIGSLLLFITVRGIAHGGLIVDVPILTKHYFGMERIGLTMGIMAVCVNLGFAVGPPVFGLLADIFGSFSVGMIIYGVIASIATLTLLPIKPRFWIAPADRKSDDVAGAAPAVAR